MGRLPNGAPQMVPLGELVTVEEKVIDKSIYHKNLMPVVYVTGDVAGKIESPVYAILKLNSAIDKLKLSEGYALGCGGAEYLADGAHRALHADGCRLVLPATPRLISS